MTETHFEGKKAVVTGSSGFLGGQIARRLVKLGAEVHGISRSGKLPGDLPTAPGSFHSYRLDLEQSGQLEARLEEIRPDYLFHSAFPGHHPHSAEARHEMIASGLGGTHRLLEALARIEYRACILLGSSLEYGSLDRPAQESDPPAPTSFRGAVKAAEYLLFRGHCSNWARPPVYLRLFSVYGPGENPRRFIPTLLRSARTGAPVRLAPPGFHHDFIHVSDAVSACLAAAQGNHGGEIFNVGSGLQYSHEEVASLVEKVTEKKLHRVREPYPLGAHDQRHWQADISKAQSRLGWKPRFSLEQGLKQFWEWMAAHD